MGPKPAEVRASIINLGEERVTPQRLSFPQPAASAPLPPPLIVIGFVFLLGLIVFVHLLLLYRA